MQQLCPQCQTTLERSGDSKRYCTSCDKNFVITIKCNKCGDALKRLKACGAVNFWCDQCNELKSKSSAIYNLIEQPK